MFAEGSIVYFDPFYFQDGAPEKPKYFIVLKILADKVILATLPSSKRHLPAQVAITHGCIEIPEGCVNCYLFEAGRVIAVNGFSFPLPTHLYGQYLDEYNISTLEDLYPIEGINYETIGTLILAELNAIKRCFAESSSVKKKFKRILGSP